MSAPGTAVEPTCFHFRARHEREHDAPMMLDSSLGHVIRVFCASDPDNPHRDMIAPVTDLPPRTATALPEPPTGKVGVYQHGRHEYVAERDRTGLVLFLQTDGPVSCTNMLGCLLDTPDDRGPDVGQTRASPTP